MRPGGREFLFLTKHYAYFGQVIEPDCVLVQTLRLRLARYEANRLRGVPLKLIDAAGLARAVGLDPAQQHLELSALHHQLAHAGVEEVLVLRALHALRQGREGSARRGNFPLSQRTKLAILSLPHHSIFIASNPGLPCPDFISQPWRKMMNLGEEGLGSRLTFF